MYSFSAGTYANVVIRPSDLQACEELLEKKKVDLLAANDLYKL
jgi:hypothetical protein